MLERQISGGQGMQEGGTMFLDKVDKITFKLHWDILPIYKLLELFQV